MTQRALNDMVSSDHPEKSPLATALLDEIETACGLTPTDVQPKGRTVWIHREWVDIEIE